jgi:lipase
MLGGLPAARFFAPRPVLIPGMIGYGVHAGAPAWTISIQAQADNLAEQIRSCGYSRAHILGHSVGGAVALLLAHRHPKLVKSIINVEGNFTVEDAFWTSKPAAMTLPEVGALLQSYQDDVPGWLDRAGIEATAERIAIVDRGLRAQPATTVKAMAQSVIETTSQATYLEIVNAVLDSDVPMHLVAGERSCAGWHVPEVVLLRAASMTIQPGVGHMMMLEAPDEFLGIVAKLIE